MRIFTLLFYPAYGLLLMSLSHPMHLQEEKRYFRHFLGGIFFGAPVFILEWIVLRRFEISQDFVSLWWGLFLDNYLFLITGVIAAWFLLWNKEQGSEVNLERLIPWTLGILFLELILELLGLRSKIHGYGLFLEPIVKGVMVTLFWGLTKHQFSNFQWLLIPAGGAVGLLGSLVGTLWFQNLWFLAIPLVVTLVAVSHLLLYKAPR